MLETEFGISSFEIYMSKNALKVLYTNIDKVILLRMGFRKKNNNSLKCHNEYFILNHKFKNKLILAFLK